IAGTATSAATATPATKSFFTTRPHIPPRALGTLIYPARCVSFSSRLPLVTVEWPSQGASGENQAKCAPLLPRCHRARGRQLQRPGVRMVPKQVGLRRVAELEFEREGKPQDNDAQQELQNLFCCS